VAADQAFEVGAYAFGVLGSDVGAEGAADVRWRAAARQPSEAIVVGPAGVPLRGGPSSLEEDGRSDAALHRGHGVRQAW
jgi:hypothetical protein